MLNKTENPCLNLILRTVRRISCDVLKSLIRAYKQFRNYKLKDLLSDDLSTSLAVAVLLVSQSMAYALLAGLRPIYGLYVSTGPERLCVCLDDHYRPEPGQVLARNFRHKTAFNR